MTTDQARVRDLSLDGQLTALADGKARLEGRVGTDPVRVRSAIYVRLNAIEGEGVRRSWPERGRQLFWCNGRQGQFGRSAEVLVPQVESVEGCTDKALRLRADAGERERQLKSILGPVTRADLKDASLLIEVLDAIVTEA